MRLCACIESLGAGNDINRVVKWFGVYSLGSEVSVTVGRLEGQTMDNEDAEYTVAASQLPESFPQRSYL